MHGGVECLRKLCVLCSMMLLSKVICFYTYVYACDVLASKTFYTVSNFRERDEISCLGILIWSLVNLA